MTTFAFGYHNRSGKKVESSVEIKIQINRNQKLFYPKRLTY